MNNIDNAENSKGQFFSTKCMLDHFFVDQTYLIVVHIETWDLSIMFQKLYFEDQCFSFMKSFMDVYNS